MSITSGVPSSFVLTFRYSPFSWADLGGLLNRLASSDQKASGSVALHQVGWFMLAFSQLFLFSIAAYSIMTLTTAERCP